MVTKRYTLCGPGEVKWAVWDHGDELIVTRGPNLTDPVAATVPVEFCRKMTDGDRWCHVQNAVGAIHVAVLLGSDSPNFRYLWRAT